MQEQLRSPGHSSDAYCYLLAPLGCRKSLNFSISWPGESVKAFKTLKTSTLQSSVGEPSQGQTVQAWILVMLSASTGTRQLLILAGLLHSGHWKSTIPLANLVCPSPHFDLFCSFHPMPFRKHPWTSGATSPKGTERVRSARELSMPWAAAVHDWCRSLKVQWPGLRAGQCCLIRLQSCLKGSGWG